MIIDDSALVRQGLSDVLTDDPSIEVIAVAQDPYVAADKLRVQVPDVIILDIEMPRMDGITFLKKLMTQHPIPTIICSTLVSIDSDERLRVFEYGAVDIIQKPKIGTRQFINEIRMQLLDVVKAASQANVKKLTKPPKRPQVKKTADVMLPRPSNATMIKTTEQIVVVGASTGGTEALRILFQQLPIDMPGMVVVQHMPEGFTAAFSRRMNEICQVTVKEAQNGDSILRGQVLVAPGNRHTLIKRSGARYYVEVKNGPLVCRHRPSVDVLFRSAAQYAGKNSVAAILTGMGDDGARGMKELKDSGAYTIAQDEASCVVFGMPKEAIKLGAVDKVISLDNITETILHALVRK